MYLLRGFVPYTLLSDNVPGVTNEIGELSVYSRTYTKQRAIFADPAINSNIRLVAFTTENDGVVEDPSIEMQQHVLKIAAFTYNLTISRPTILLELADFHTALMDNHAASIENLRIGKVVTDGRFYMPEWLEWSMKGQPDNYIKIWFSDEAFRLQFPDFEIVVTPPFLPVDDFFKPADQVKKLLASRDVTQIAQDLQNAKKGHPETFIRIDQFDYIDPRNDKNIIPTAWGILIYGLGGNNLDAIKQALQDFILANSNHPREDWVKILPDIFKRTEFIFSPIWDKYSIPNKKLEKGIYRPIFNFNEALDYTTEQIPSYPETHIKRHIEGFSFPHRSLSMTAIGNIENKDNIYRITEVFPDWINVSSTHHDFARMSSRTQKFHLLLADMVHHAETFVEYDAIPEGMMKVKRDDKLFLSATYEKFNYMVLCKSSVVTEE